MTVSSVSKDSPLPLYYQLTELLRSKIESGEWKPGQQIPTEQELCEQNKVSRITVRQSLSNLVHEGLLYRAQGKGTFVTMPRIQQGPQRLTSFSEDMQQRGMRPGAKVLDIEVLPAPAGIASKLRLEPGEPVIMIKRLRLADDEPMGIQTAYIPHRLCPHLVNDDLNDQSLYQLLSTKYGLRPRRATESYVAVQADKGEARLLKSPENAAVLAVERISYSADGQPIEFVRSVMRGDRYSVSVELVSE
ncbi:MAG: GntR family transcriptional regulator [Chloroflexi bacterium]|nr:GntR family transcriptional regulator [Chloroflexota bacterium]MCL5076157.1 GntR family transcriptional regulator [Chloroflexota bacterium]